jgi:hypothetical protein
MVFKDLLASTSGVGRKYTREIVVLQEANTSCECSMISMVTGEKVPFFSPCLRVVG